MMTGACCSPDQLGRARQASSLAWRQNRPVCSGPSRTTNAEPCEKPAEGARRALARMRSTSGGGDRAVLEGPPHPPPAYRLLELHRPDGSQPRE